MSRARRFTGFAALGLAAALAGPAPSRAYTMAWSSGSGWKNLWNEVACTNLPGFAHWSTSNIDWYLNTNGQGAGKQYAIQAALTTWNDAGTEYNLRYAGTTSTDTYMARDNRNTISWGINSVCDSRFCHAITSEPWRSTSAHPARSGKL